MPNPPKQYGAPGFQAPGQTTRQRPQAKPASAAEIHQRLNAREQEIRLEQQRIDYVRKKVGGGQQQAAPVGGLVRRPAAPVRGSSSTALAGQKAPPIRVEKAIKDAGG